jgi:hypothetical protein
MWVNVFVFFTDMGSAFDMVEHMVWRRMGWYGQVLFHAAATSCRANFAGWWARLAIAYVLSGTPRPLGHHLSAPFPH